MKTRQEAMIELIAGLGSWTPDNGKVEYANDLLWEINERCGLNDTCPKCAATGVSRVDSGSAKPCVNCLGVGMIYNKDEDDIGADE